MDETPAEEEAKPVRKRRTKAQILADNLAQQERIDSNTIPTSEFVDLLRIWEKRYNACTDAEKTLQKTCGLRFLSRSQDFENGGEYDEDDRFNPRPDAPTEIAKEKIARAIKVVKRSYGVDAYGIKWLEKQLQDKYGLSFKVYNDTYTVTWEMKVSANDLTQMGWDGTETAATIGDILRYGRGLRWREGTLSTQADPQRALDAAAREAAKAELKAAQEAALQSAPATQEEADKQDEEEQIQKDLEAAKAQVQEIVADTNRLTIPITDTAALTQLRETLAGIRAGNLAAEQPF